MDSLRDAVHGERGRRTAGNSDCVESFALFERAVGAYQDRGSLDDTRCRDRARCDRHFGNGGNVGRGRYDMRCALAGGLLFEAGNPFCCHLHHTGMRRRAGSGEARDKRKAG